MEAGEAGFVATGVVDGQRMVTETGSTELGALALANYVLNELNERVHMPAHEIQITVRRG